MKRRLLVLAAVWMTGAQPGGASNLCQDFTPAAEELELIYLDLADPLVERVTQPVEADLLSAQVSGNVPGPLQKLYCRVGIHDLHVRFVQPAEDDAFAAVVTEVRYEWDATQDPAGWILSGLRRQPACARGAALFSDVCP